MTTQPPNPSDRRATDASGEPVTLGTFNTFEVYPMPMFATLTTREVARLAQWYEQALGFGVMFSTPGPDGQPMMVHLRRLKYQDVLIVAAAPGATTGAPASPGLSISFRVDDSVADLAARARGVATVGASAIVGPIDTPWNTTDLRVTDPEGHRLVFTARRDNPDPEQVKRWAAMMDAARNRPAGG
jgi:uncharacterized glyoxalase superfamily protein PhnB